MGEADLPRLGHVAAADEPCVGYGVMRGAKLALDDERAAIQHSGDAEYLGRLQGLVEAERREDPGEALGEHRLAGPGRTDHEHVVRAGRGDLETPLCVFLALHVFEIQLVRGAGAPYRVEIGFYHRQVGPAVKIFDDLRRGDLPGARKTED